MADAAFQRKDTQVLGISTDAAPTQKAFSSSIGGVPYPLLGDFHPKGQVAQPVRHLQRRARHRQPRHHHHRQGRRSALGADLRQHGRADAGGHPRRGGQALAVRSAARGRPCAGAWSEDVRFVRSDASVQGRRPGAARGPQGAALHGAPAARRRLPHAHRPLQPRRTVGPAGRRVANHVQGPRPARRQAHHGRLLPGDAPHSHRGLSQGRGRDTGVRRHLPGRACPGSRHRLRRAHVRAAAGRRAYRVRCVLRRADRHAGASQGQRWRALPRRGQPEPQAGRRGAKALPKTNWTASCWTCPNPGT